MSWLDELKVGDKVVIYTQYGEKCAIVEKVTRADIIVDGDKYKKSSGDLRDRIPYAVDSLEQWSQEWQDARDYKREMGRLCSYLREIDWNKYTLEFLRQVYGEVQNATKGV